MHWPILETTTQYWANEWAAQAWAQRLGASAALAQATLTLSGELGAGKTTVVRYLLRALGVLGRVKSPSYAIVELYQAPASQAHEALAIAHFDFYRFNDAREWEDAGLRELFAAPGLKLCEWPERAAPLLPAPDLAVYLTVATQDARSVRLNAHTPRGQTLLRDAGAVVG